jgi:monoamine oxidase
MERAEFIKKLLLMSFGLRLTPLLSFGTSINRTYRVGIIGAGVSGLYLAKHLKQQGHSVTILEARNKAGGRVAENTSFHTEPIDLGAQWIHGKNELYKLVKQTKISIYEDKKNDNIRFIYKGMLGDEFPKEFYGFLKEINKKTPFKDDLSVLDFARQFNSDLNFIELIESALTDTATKASNFSVNEISKLTNKLKTKDYQFSNTTMYGFINQNFIEHLEKEIIYEFQVESLDYSGQRVIISSNTGRQLEFDKVIVTIPISELKSRAIMFQPDLPTEKWEVFNKIGMDKGLKLFLKFEKQFFTHSLFNGEFAGYYIDPTKINSTRQSLLVSLIMGNNAEKYYNNPSKAVENYLTELDRYYNGQASKYFIDAYVQDWGNEAFINGVYSYTKVGGQSARTIARKPINDKVYFAGEAMNTKRNYGNVHGAIESAIDVLKEIK